MRWWSFVGVVVVLAGCGEKQTAPPVGDGLAGVVLGVEGDVSAQRTGAGARKLTERAEVFADDTVTCAPAASVRIQLAHNQVVWTLEGGAAGVSRKLVDGVAWKAPKASGGAAVLAAEEANRAAAAGRHTEPEAAGTAADVEAEAPPPPEKAAAEAKAEPPREETKPDEAKMAEARAKQQPKHTKKRGRDDEDDVLPPAPPPPPPAPAPAAPAAVERPPEPQPVPPPVTKAPGPSLPPVAAPPPPKPLDTSPDDDILGKKSGGGGGGLGGLGGIVKGGKSSGVIGAPRPEEPVGVQIVEMGEGMDGPVAMRILRYYAPGVQQCVAEEQKAGTRVVNLDLDLVISDVGRVVQATATGSAALKSCVEEKARAFRFPKVPGLMKLKVRYGFVKPR